MNALRNFAIKLWTFLKNFVRNSLALFKRELREKQSNVKEMDSTARTQFYWDTGVSFFASAAKVTIEQSLLSQSRKMSMLSEALVLPFDGCFNGEDRSFSILRFVSTASRNFWNAAVHGHRPTLTNQASFNINLNQLSSLLA